MRKRIRFLYAVVLTLGLLLSVTFIVERFGWTLLGLAARAPDTFSAEIEAFKDQDKKSGFRADAILFVGSSSFTLWEDMEARFAPRVVINRGFGGAHLRHVLRHYDEVIKTYQPRALVLYAGENDLAASVKPEIVLSDTDKLLEKVRSDFPDMPVMVVSIKPSPLRAGDLAVQLKVNEGIRQRAENDPHLHYVDIATPMMKAARQGLTDSLFKEDQLHLTAKGYDIWAAELSWYFDRLFGRIELGPLDQG